MNCNTGDIMHIAVEDKDLYDFFPEDELSSLVALEEKEVPKLKRMNKLRRKNWMRNKPCPCKSGKKFKKCCWSKVSKEGL